MRDPFAKLLGSLALTLVAGCFSIPEAVTRDFDPPDGKRPNNFGRMVEGPQGQGVEPDTPTIRGEEGS